MDLGLKGKKAIVTGGTRGIGRAIADLLADEGCDVAICARNAAQVDEAVAALKAKGVRATGEAVDVADLDAFEHFIGQAANELGGLDVFVSNVSAMGGGNDLASWQRSVQIDILATVRGCEAAIPHLERDGGGAIVVVGTISALETPGGRGPYASVKAAQVPYIKALARDLAPKGVRANLVAPGTIYFEGGVWHQVEQGMPDFFKTMVGRNPMGRMGTPEEIANAVAFLASPRAGFITGENLVADGAMTQRVGF